jgi:hypothetical protein
MIMMTIVIMMTMMVMVVINESIREKRIENEGI